MASQELKPVFAWDHFHLQPADRWLVEAQAFADSAHHLFGEMAAEEFERSWPRAKAAGFLLGHSIELFFKATFAQAGESIPKHHHLDKLFERFQHLYPGLTFTAAIPSLIDADKSKPFYLFLKYPEDETDIGKRWDASIHIDVAEWHRQITQYLRDIPRLWAEVKARRP